MGTGKWRDYDDFDKESNSKVNDDLFHEQGDDNEGMVKVLK